MTKDNADTFVNQLGNKAIAMLGAKNFGYSELGLTFQIQGCKEISHIRVRLDCDLYKMAFLKVKTRGKIGVTTVKEVDMVSAENICHVIETATGLRTSL